MLQARWYSLMCLLKCTLCPFDFAANSSRSNFEVFDPICNHDIKEVEGACPNLSQLGAPNRWIWVKIGSRPKDSIHPTRGQNLMGQCSSFLLCQCQKKGMSKTKIPSIADSKSSFFFIISPSFSQAVFGIGGCQIPPSLRCLRKRWFFLATALRAGFEETRHPGRAMAGQESGEYWDNGSWSVDDYSSGEMGYPKLSQVWNGQIQMCHWHWWDLVPPQPRWFHLYTAQTNPMYNT